MKLLLLQSVGLLFISSCIVQRGAPVTPQGSGAVAPATGATPEAAPPTITGTLAGWTPFPGASVRIELPQENDTMVATSATATFDQRGGFAITLPTRAQIAPQLNGKTLRVACGTFAIAPVDARLATAVFAVYNAAGNRTGILLNGDAPASLGEAPRGNRHGLVFADVATKISGACSTPADERYDVTLVPGWNVMAFATAPAQPTMVSTGALPFSGNWYYVAQPGPALSVGSFAPYSGAGLVK